MSDSSSSASSVDDNPKEEKDGTKTRNSNGNSQVNTVVPSVDNYDLYICD
jgi:hypothetical protein